LQRKCFCNVLRFAPPGGDPVVIGVFLYDSATERLHMRFRRHWNGMEKDHVEVLAALADDLASQAGRVHPLELQKQLEDTLSNAVLISERRYLGPIADPATEVDRLYATFAERTAVGNL
jgi:hypothetical protein